jgi:HK97 family phage portal protein
MKWFRREGRQSSLAEPTQDLITALGGEASISGERINVDSALRIADVFCAVSIITETVATLPLRVYRRLNGDVIEAPDHRAANMLEVAPNPVQPAHRFWSTIAGHQLCWGNWFIEKLRDEAGLVSELWALHPATVEIQFNATLRQKRYVVWDGATKRVLDDDRVLHGFGYSTDGLVGLSPIQQCRQQLGIAKARERFEGEVYAQKPFLSGVIQHPGQLRDTVKLRESWSAIYGGGDPGPRGTSGRHSVAVLEEGASFSPLTAPLEDMQFVESQQLSRTTIANIFKLPPSYIGGSVGDSLTYQTVESNQIQFARNAITPVTVNIQKFLGFDRGVFPFSSWYPEFVLDALLRGDSMARGAYYKALSDVKAITPNEIRAFENMPPIAGGDKSPAKPEPIPPALAAASVPDAEGVTNEPR